MKRTYLTLSAAALVLSGAAQASVLWQGNYETGDLSQWDGVDGLQSRLSVVQNPVHEGRYAMRVELHQGDVSSSGTRNEVELGNHRETEGTERWYAWSTMFPSDYPSNNTWQVFTQWHHSGCCGSPPLEFDVIGERIQMTHAGDQSLWTAPLVRGVWHDFVLHVKWSSSSGFVELWYDGKKALDQTSVQTLNPGEYNYMKQGLYWNASITSVGVVYHDRTVMGTSIIDVAPELEPGVVVPDAGTPAPVADAGTAPGQDAGAGAPPDGSPAPQDPGAAPLAVAPDAGVPLAAASIGFPRGGCSSLGGSSFAALGIIALGLFALRRRKRS